MYSAARRRLDRMQIFPPRLIIFQSYLLMVRTCTGIVATKLQLRTVSPVRTAVFLLPDNMLRDTSLQVRLQLGLAHYQTAWLSFSRAARYAQLLGLHRASTESPSVEQLRRRWSAFQMDRFASLFPLALLHSD